MQQLLRLIIHHLNNEKTHVDLPFPSPSAESAEGPAAVETSDGVTRMGQHTRGNVDEVT